MYDQYFWNCQLNMESGDALKDDYSTKYLLLSALFYRKTVTKVSKFLIASGKHDIERSTLLGLSKRPCPKIFLDANTSHFLPSPDHLPWPRR